jgi:hypothetical protein
LPFFGCSAGLRRGYTNAVARNLYILAGVLPANGTLWRTTALFLTVGGLAVALLGIMTALFEQIDRRTEERRWRQRGGDSRGR